jgi:hypothetical protein
LAKFRVCIPIPMGNPFYFGTMMFEGSLIIAWRLKNR